MDNMNTASAEELIKYALDTLGIEIAPDTDADTARSLIEQAIGEVPEKEPADTGNPRGRAANARKKKRRREYDIRLHRAGRDKAPVILRVNGTVVQIQRGVQVTVSEEVLEVLRNATFHSLDENTLSESEDLTDSYPFTVLESRIVTG